MGLYNPALGKLLLRGNMNGLRIVAKAPLHF